MRIPIMISLLGAGVVQADWALRDVKDWVDLAALTRSFDIADNQSAFARLQANFDGTAEGDEQSVFLQLGYDWGGSEIR